MGMTFDMKETTKCHPHQCSGWGVGTPKLKNLRIFRICPTGVYPLGDFYKIFKTGGKLHVLLTVKFWWNRSRGSRVKGFKARGTFPPYLQCPKWWNYTLHVNTFWMCKNCMGLLYHHAKLVETVTSPLSHLNSEMILTSLHRGRYVVGRNVAVHHSSILSLYH